MRHGQSTILATAAFIALGLSGAMTGSASAAPPAGAKQTCVPALIDTDYQIVGADRFDAAIAELAGLGLSSDAARASLLTLQAAGGAEKSWRPGSRVTVARRIDPCDADAVEVESITLSTDQGAEVTVARGQGGGFALVRAEDRALVHLTVAGVIETSELGPGLLDGGVPSMVADQVVDGFAASPTAPSGVLHGARFVVQYDVTATNDGAPIEATLSTATITVNGQERRVHFFRPAAGRGTELGEEKTSIVPVAFIHPVPEGVFTSGFGWRRHPVLHRQLFHMGVDFSAPRGTPVRAAADGVVEEAGRSGNYGRLIRLAHDGKTETVYAHLDGMAKGLRVGAQVKQGEIIGYVGRTGLASGAHLYFEVRVDGKNVDPLSVDPALMAAAAQAAETDRPLKRFITNVSAEAPAWTYAPHR